MLLREETTNSFISHRFRLDDVQSIVNYDDVIRDRHNTMQQQPGEMHWQIDRDICF